MSVVVDPHSRPTDVGRPRCNEFTIDMHHEGQRLKKKKKERV